MRYINIINEEKMKIHNNMNAYDEWEYWNKTFWDYLSFSVLIIIMQTKNKYT